MKNTFKVLIAASLVVQVIGCGDTNNITNNYTTTIVQPPSVVLDSGAVSAQAPDAMPAVKLDAGLAPDAAPVVMNDAQVAADSGLPDALSASTGYDAQPPIDSLNSSEAGTAATSCRNTKNVKITEGVAGNVFAYDHGFAVVWRDIAPSLQNAYFRTYDWDGVPTSNVVTLFNLLTIIGGKDEFLGIFFDDRGMAREWSYYAVNSDGSLGKGGLFTSNQDKDDHHQPFSSFDGTYYRLTNLFPGSADVFCPAGSTIVSTGRVSMASGGLNYDNTGCISRPYSSASVLDVADNGNGKPTVLVYSWVTQTANGEYWDVVDFAHNSVYSPFVGDVNKRPFYVLSAPGMENAMLAWNQAGGNINYLGPLNGTGSILTGVPLPSGFSPAMIDGNSIVALKQDQLSWGRTFLKTDLAGQETARVELPVADSTCALGTDGRNGKFAVIDNGACYAGAGSTTAITVSIVSCD